MLKVCCFIQEGWKKKSTSTSNSKCSDAFTLSAF